MPAHVGAQRPGNSDLDSGGDEERKMGRYEEYSRRLFIEGEEGRIIEEQRNCKPIWWAIGKIGERSGGRGVVHDGNGLNLVCIAQSMLDSANALPRIRNKQLRVQGLPLLVLRVLATNDVHPALALDALATGTQLLDRRPDLHAAHLLLANGKSQW